MSTRTVELAPDTFELVSREAARRGVSPGQVVEDIIRTDLSVAADDLELALQGAAVLRSKLPRVDGVKLARQARADLQARGT